MLRLTALGLLLRAGQSAISLLNVLLLARALGPVGRGEYFLFVAAVALLARILDLGMSPSAVVFASQHSTALGAMHRRLIALGLGFWAVAATLFVVALRLTNLSLEDLPAERLVLAVAILPFALYEQLWVHLMVGLRRIISMNAVQLCAGLAGLGLNVALVVIAQWGVVAAIAIYAGVLVAKTVPMLVLIDRALPRTAQHQAAPTVRELMSFALRAYPNALAALAWTRLPAFVLDVVKGAGAVGVFSVAQQILEQMLLPLQATQDAIYKTIATEPRDGATAAMNRYLRVGVWSMLPLAIGCAAVAPWVVPVIFGQDFASAVLVLQILLISLLASVVPALLSPYFFGQLQRPALASGLAWVRVVLSLGLALPLARALGEVGVAASLAIADVCSTLLILILYGRIAHTPLTQAVLPRTSDFGVVLRRLRHSEAL